MNSREESKLREIIASLAGETLAEGTVVDLTTNLTDAGTLGLLRYEGDVAVLVSASGEITRAPKSTVFDANAAYRQLMQWAAVEMAKEALAAPTN